MTMQRNKRHLSVLVLGVHFLVMLDCNNCKNTQIILEHGIKFFEHLINKHNFRIGEKILAKGNE